MPTDKALPPEAEQIEKKLVTHGHTRLDPYYWLRNRESAKTLAYLNAENRYREQEMTTTEDLQEKLFQEIKGRIKEEDQSVPYQKNGYWYYTRFAPGQEHPIYCRKKGNLQALEEILIDANLEAAGHQYFKIGGLSVSDDNRYLAYGVDTLSRRIYQIKIRDLKTGKDLPDQLEYTSGSAAWSADGQFLFYTVKDAALRPAKVMRHRLGADPKEDHLLFHEDDETFYCGVYRSKSRRFLMIASHSTLSAEYQFLPADRPTDTFQVLQARQRGLEYQAAHYGDHWYIRTNADGAENFKLMRSPVDQPGQEHWSTLIAHRPEVYLEGLEIMASHLILEERKDGLGRLRIKSWTGEEDYYLPIEGETYTVAIGNNPDFDSGHLRYVHSSLTQPTAVYDYDLRARSSVLKKQKEVVGGYDPQAYASERLWATGRDGVKIPISLVYRKDTRNTEKGNPLLLYGYGSYGATIDPSFSSVRLSLLDRGFVFAIAHIRGGQYLGRQWYEAGKMLQKRNTFYDFIDCSKFLLQEKYARPDGLYAMGGSAGGLLMGTVINEAPELYAGVVAAVPFVDVVTTMLDESIPLTTGEFDEWGNPKDEEYYRYMLSYSPYDNVRAQDYPPLMITTGLHDSQVQYWEPAKWCAKLRQHKTDQNPLYLYCNMETGHGGASGRFEAYRETAMEYAFLFQLEKRTE